MITCAGRHPPERLRRVGAAAELGLDGRLRPVAGVLAMMEAAERLGLDGMLVAPESAGEASLAGGVPVLAPRYLNEAVDVLAGRRPRRSCRSRTCVRPRRFQDLADVRGNCARGGRSRSPRRVATTC